MRDGPLPAGARTPSLFTLARRDFLVIFGAIWLAVGLVALVVGTALVIRERRFATERRQATAEVVAKELQKEGSESGGAAFVVTYRFEAPEGRSFEGRDSLDAVTWTELERGAPLEVEYLARDPGTNRVAGTSDEAGAWVALGMGLLFAPVGGFLFQKGFRRLRRWRRLTREGVPAEGTVTRVGETNVSFNRRRMWEVRYTYSDPLGRTREGTSGYIESEVAREYSEGDKVGIRVDPRDPSQSAWMGTCTRGTDSS